MSAPTKALQPAVRRTTTTAAVDSQRILTGGRTAERAAASALWILFYSRTRTGSMSAYDYEDLGLVAGLEIHQQLDTATKLFCDCPTTIREPEESDRSFTRFLHPTKSELGEIDEAALEESMVDREFEYLSYDTTCLVEEDDEPPHRVDREAMETTLESPSYWICPSPTK